jgi:hypothetical protein
MPARGEVTLSPLFPIIVFYTLLGFGNELPPVRFSATDHEEILLWKQTVDEFLVKNPNAQLLQKDSLEALYLPPTTDKHRLLILSSGIHGAEAFAGSALQRAFLQKWSSQKDSTGLLIIHILNPHGFSNFRRTNSQNVDLNRNFFSEPLPTNSAYQKMQWLLEPKAPASTSLLSKWRFFVGVSWFYITHGKKAILNTLSGQSHSPQGLYFSGTENQPETLIVQNWILQIAQDFSTVLHIDLHTGFGERSKLHFYGSEEFRKPEQLQSLQKIFPKAEINTANDADFYPTHGDFIDWTWKALPNKTVIPMVFEFGTKDSQTLLGGMESLWISVIENQGFHFGYETEADKQNTLRLFESLFKPQDEDWQKAVLLQGEEALSEALRNLEKL